MHRIAILLISLLIIVAPVAAQDTAPTPSAEELVFLDRMLQYVQAATASDGSTVNTTVVLFGVFLIVFAVLLLLGIRAFAKPFLGLLEDAQDRAEKAEDEAEARRKEARADYVKFQESQQKTAESQERTATILLNLSTAQQDNDRTEAAQNKIIHDVNENTGAVVKPVDDKLKTVAETLEELKRDVVTKQSLTETIDPLVRKIDAALQVIHDLQQPDAPPAPAPETAPAESGTLSEVDAKQE